MVTIVRLHAWVRGSIPTGSMFLFFWLGEPHETLTYLSRSLPSLSLSRGTLLHSLRACDAVRWVVRLEVLAGALATWRCASVTLVLR